ncbi:unnamed protein product [Paramecium pentaurelia]|uniref:Uncharacterized protein n=1 Tax=Paramecium pentaurelia TaxID=43138 RepID=A0A8S1S5T1_9CILI|nr:unnamed protein product [Paramecium pentaurelia]
MAQNNQRDSKPNNNKTNNLGIKNKSNEITPKFNQKNHKMKHKLQVQDLNKLKELNLILLLKVILLVDKFLSHLLIEKQFLQFLNLNGLILRKNLNIWMLLSNHKMLSIIQSNQKWNNVLKLLEIKIKDKLQIDQDKVNLQMNFFRNIKIPSISLDNKYIKIQIQLSPLFYKFAFLIMILQKTDMLEIQFIS